MQAVRLPLPPMKRPLRIQPLIQKQLPIARMGHDIAEIDEQRKRDQDREKKLGIEAPVEEKKPGRPVGSVGVKENGEVGGVALV